MTEWLTCPTDHRADDPPMIVRRLAHGYDEEAAHHVITALISEGHCPACPTVELDHHARAVVGQHARVYEPVHPGFHRRVAGAGVGQ